MRKPVSKRGIAALIVVLIVIAAVAMLLHRPAPVVAAEAPTLLVAKVANRDILHVVQLPGEFVPFQEVDIDAKVRGYVDKMNVDIGDVVKEGQLLATLDIPEVKDQLRQADAAVARAQQDAARARAEYDDDKAVYDRLSNVMHERPDLIAQQDIDQSKAKSDSSNASFTAAQSAIQEAQANRERLKSIGDYSRITAPFDGTITQRFVSVGALVGDNSGPSATRAIFHISEVQKLRLVIKPPESEVPDLAIGKIVKIEIDALHQTVQAPISRISHELAMATRTMHVEVDVENPKLAIAPGMFAQVSLPLQEHASAIAIPLGALHNRKDEQGTAYVLQPDNTAVSREVKLGLLGNDDVEIESGLKLGESVVLDTVPQTDGTHYTPRVVVDDTKPDKAAAQ